MRIHGSGWALGILLLSASCTAELGAQGPPNIVILFADDLGYGDLSSYGHPVIRTPEIDRLADEGLRFTSFYAGAPSCTPSRAALLTGKYGLRVGLPVVLGPESTAGIPETEKTMAEALKELGYRTWAVGKWHVGHTDSTQLPVGQGFDGWFGLPYSNDMIRPFVQTDVPLRYYRDAAALDEPRVVQSELTMLQTEEAVRFIGDAAGSPFFLYLAYSMPHLPIAVPDSLSGRSRAGRYGDVIETLDWSVGQVRRALEAQGVLDNTVVVFTSDNGPWLSLPDRMLQEGVRRWDAGSPGPLRGWKGNTYEGGQRVPAVIRWPGVVEAGRVTAEPASVLDLLPTVVAAVGGMPGPGLDGRDLRPVLDGTGSLGERPFYYVRDGWVEAVRVGAWKLRASNHLKPEADRTDPPEPELFNLDVDPSERFDRADEFPELARKLQDLLDAASLEMGGR